MKKIKPYIIEKLNLNNKGIHKDKRYMPKTEDYKKLENELIDHSYQHRGYMKYECEDLAASCKNSTTCLRLWIALQLMTNSTPYLYKSGVIRSYPGNYGTPLVDKLIDKFDFTAQEILDEFEDYKEYDKRTLPVDLEVCYHDAIYGLLNNFDYEVRKNFKVEYRYFIPDGDCFSDKGKELLNDYEDILVLPFDLTYNNKTLSCEISQRGRSYFHYKVNNKIYRISHDFYADIIKEFGL